MKDMFSIVRSTRKVLLLLLCLASFCFLFATQRAFAADSQPGAFDGPAELPRVRMETSLRSTPAPGKVIRVRAGQDLGEALEKASCGDTVELQAGALPSNFSSSGRA